VEAEGVLPLILAFLPYVTFVVTLGGLLYRIFSWASARPRRYKVRKYYYEWLWPIPGLIVVRIVKGLILELLLLRRVFRGSKPVWVVTLLFHWSMLGMAVGHLRIFTEYPSFFWQFMGITTPEGMEWFSAVTGITVGLIFIVSLVLLLLRRIVIKEVRMISTFEDYVLLLLLLAIGIVGEGQRFFTHISLEQLEALRMFWLNLLAFTPTPMPVTDPWFMAHCALAQIIIMYLPFSKLIHVLGNLISTIVEEWEGTV
jgi:nitrate reductase gamma subunit